ncbi:MAG TPA: NAD(P)/FAD-dependent oxidoreductase [Vicinamibacterales bacterium]|jgi:NADH dehydrogenase|nr:NAD(P)/FAD-dependent oxidoreductase [Vicinamibacterales bacterium]
MSEPHVVIIGGGFGGLTAAKILRNTECRVTLLDRRNHHVFQPLLYQVAAAALSPGDIAAPIRWVLRRSRNVRVLLAEVATIDVDTRRVVLTDAESVAYDYLIVAPGASHTYFGHPEWESSAPGLKTLEDALEIRRRVLLAFERAERETDPARRRELLTFVLVGGGPTGVELAGTLAEIARQTLRDEFTSIDTSVTRIVLVEAGQTILPSFPEKLRDAARHALVRLRVEVREHTTVTGVDQHGVWLGQERLDAGTILWAAGVAASPLLKTLGSALDRAGRVVVEPDLSIAGHPEVFVIGDAAAFHQDGQLLPGVAQVAIQGAAHAAKTILRREHGEPSTTFVYRDLGNLAIIGRGSAIADIGRLHFSGPLAWLFWLFLHIFKLIGFRNRLSVMLQWGWAYVTFQRSVRLITQR